MKPATDEMKTYLLSMKDGDDKKVTVPAHWRVTFGPIAPGSKGGDGYNGQSGLCLRFYEGSDKENQRAVFSNVIGFRDTSIQIEEKRITTKAETAYKETPQGRKSFIMEGKVTEWVDPDAPQTHTNEFVTNQPAMLELKTEEQLTGKTRSKRSRK